MKKTIIILSILIISAIIAFSWVGIENYILEKNYPLEYSNTIEQASREFSVPKELIYAVIKTESGFKSDAKSQKGAMGLMQIMPSTFKYLCEKAGDANKDKNLLNTPEINIHYGVYYLDMLYSEFGSWELALASYNAGPANVRKWLKDENLAKDGVLIEIPYKETREYVTKVMKAKDVYTKLYFETSN